MKATLLSLNASLEMASENQTIDALLRSIPDGKFLIVPNGGVGIAEAESYKILSITGSESPKLVQQLFGTRAGSRFRVEVSGLEGTDEGNVSLLAGRSTVSFSGFGDLATTLLNGEYPLQSIAGETVAGEVLLSVPWVTDEGGGAYASTEENLNFYDSDDFLLNTVTVSTGGGDASTLFSNLQGQVGGTWSFDSNGVLVGTGFSVGSYVQTDSSDTSTAAQGPSTTGPDIEGDALFLDQIARTIAIVSATETAGGGSLVTSEVAELERSVESGSFFE